MVTDITTPDWDQIMKKAGAIITNKGGRTSHAAIVARELGTVAVVGCGNATEAIKDGQEVTPLIPCSYWATIPGFSLVFFTKKRFRLITNGGFNNA